MSDRLAEILKKADALAEMPGIRADMAGRVRRVHRMRRIIRTGTAIASVIVLIMAMIPVLRNKTRPVVAINGVPHRTDLRELEADARLHQMIADLLEQHERESALPSGAADEYLWNLSQQANRAALILIHSGDVMDSRFHDRSAALDDYEAAVRKFPRCPAAAVAQARILAIEHRGNES